MAEEEVKPVEEVVAETPPEEAKPEETKVEAAVEETPPAEAKTEEPPEEAKSDWREKELKSKHRQLQEAKRREAELQVEIETQRALLAKFNQGKTEEQPTFPAEEVEKRVQAEIAQRIFVEKSNAIDTEGNKAYGESWKPAIENLEILGGFDHATMNGVLATDDPAKVIFELGKNPDNYKRIMGLPLERRIIEMGRLAMQPVTKTVSSAPAPVSPVGGRAAPASATLRDDMPDDQWYSIRHSMRAEHKKKNGDPTKFTATR